ncbi:MAG: hypothetical protein HY378_00560 [Candidatus Brennerbacteria bacterium]|nr:hypothetical protein [Candidatus Brennerbacteria bacterium]
MRLPATEKVTRFLRERNRIVRSNNLKINEWVDDYVDVCIRQGEPITILTQWCISKNLELRLEKQDGVFLPTKKERNIFEVELPRIAEAFQTNGVRVNWWITFSRSYLDSRRVGRDIEAEYKGMIEGLAEPLINQGWLFLLDWEDDVLGGRSQPSTEVLDSIERFVKPEALELEMQWNSTWAEKETGLRQSQEELRRDVCFQVACEAEEGRFLTAESPLGEFILVPLEVPEQYDFFAIFAKDFKKRIAAVLPPYPWRLKDTT